MFRSRCLDEEESIFRPQVRCDDGFFSRLDFQFLSNCGLGPIYRARSKSIFSIYFIQINDSLIHHSTVCVLTELETSSTSKLQLLGEVPLIIVFENEQS